MNKIIIHPPPLPTSTPTTTTPPPPPVTAATQQLPRVKPTPSTSTSGTRKSNLPLTRHTATRTMSTSTSSTTSSTNKKRTLTGLRNSSVPTTTSTKSTSPSPSSATAAATPTKRSTLTPTTSLTMSPTPPSPQTVQQPQPPVMMTRKKSTPSPATPPPVPPAVATLTPSEVEAKIKQETSQLYEILEKVQRERDTLLSQMKNKETAWERLVSSKESLLLQVEEKEYKSQRLQKELEDQKLQLEELQHGLAERDASLAKNQRDDEKASQDQRRIERLETLVRELQATIKTTQEDQLAQSRQHQGAMDQVRREVAASEAQAASLEKECEELRRAGLEAIHAYENSVVQLTEKHQLELQQKDRQIQQLDHTIADLRHKQSTLFDDDEEQDIESRLKALSHHQQPQHERLEEQLELTMTELDSERLVIQQLRNELDTCKLELNQSRAQILSVESKYQALQIDFEKELADKKRLIEEADNAFEQQAKAEDEHYQIKLSKLQLEKEYTELVETHKQLENDYNQLMDEMLALEEGGDAVTKTETRLKSIGGGDALEEKIQLLEKENESHRHSLSLKATQVNQLTKDLAELESLVENRVFGESELEEQLELERKKASSLERELKDLKAQLASSRGGQGEGRDSFYKNLLISPTTTTTSNTTTSPTQHHEEEEEDKYCELCEQYGHDLLQCKSTSSFVAGDGKMVSRPLSRFFLSCYLCQWERKNLINNF